MRPVVADQRHGADAAMQISEELLAAAISTESNRGPGAAEAGLHGRDQRRARLRSSGGSNSDDREARTNAKQGHSFESPRVDPRANNPNHPSLFEGVPVPIDDFRRERAAVAIAAICKYVERFGRPPTAEAWVTARMTPSEKTIRRRFGSFRAAIEAAGLQ